MGHRGKFAIATSPLSGGRSGPKRWAWMSQPWLPLRPWFLERGLRWKWSAAQEVEAGATPRLRDQARQAAHPLLRRRQSRRAGSLLRKDEITLVRGGSRPVERTGGLRPPRRALPPYRGAGGHGNIAWFRRLRRRRAPRDDRPRYRRPSRLAGSPSQSNRSGRFA